MAITAFRPDGASHKNRFLGAIVRASGSVPESGEVPAAAVVPGTVAVAFGPLDMPGVVFDDISRDSNPDLQRWAQNAEVVCASLDGNVADAVLSAQAWSLDSQDRPILNLDLSISALPAQVDIQVVIPHSKVR